MPNTATSVAYDYFTQDWRNKLTDAVRFVIVTANRKILERRSATDRGIVWMFLANITNEFRL